MNWRRFLSNMGLPPLRQAPPITSVAADEPSDRCPNKRYHITVRQQTAAMRILIGLMTALGHERRFRPVLQMSASPLTAAE
jgi:hypothetical protein